MPKLNKNILLILFIIIILYGLSWVMYAVTYSGDKQVVLQHYGGLNTYTWEQQNADSQKVLAILKYIQPHIFFHF